MEFKDTTKILALEDKVENKTITFDEVKLEDADYIHIKLFEGKDIFVSDIYLNMDQATDLTEKLNRFIYHKSSQTKQADKEVEKTVRIPVVDRNDPHNFGYYC